MPYSFFIYVTLRHTQNGKNGYVIVYTLQSVLRSIKLEFSKRFRSWRDFRVLNQLFRRKF